MNAVGETIVGGIMAYILSQGSSIEAQNVSIYMFRNVLERFSRYSPINIESAVATSDLPDHVKYFFRCQRKLTVYAKQNLDETVRYCENMIFNLSILFDRKDLIEQLERLDKNTYQKLPQKKLLWKLAYTSVAIHCMIDGIKLIDDELYIEAKRFRYYFGDSKVRYKEIPFDISSMPRNMVGYMSKHMVDAKLFNTKVEAVMENIFKILIEKGAFPEHIIQFNNSKTPRYYVQSDPDKFEMINFSELPQESKLSVIRMMPHHFRYYVNEKKLWFLSNGNVQQANIFLIPNTSINTMPKNIYLSEGCLGCENKDGCKACFNCIQTLCCLEKGEEIKDLTNEDCGCYRFHKIGSKRWPSCLKCVFCYHFDNNWDNVESTYERLCNNSDFDIVGNLEKIRSFIERDGKDFHNGSYTKRAIS
jgi:hypothetical protein